MKRLLLSIFLSLPILNSICHADYDAALEAREDAKRQAAQAEAAKQKARTDAMVQAAQAKAEREYIGTAANGKSDAEVHRLYSAKVQADQSQAISLAQNAKQLQASNQRKIDETKLQREEGVKNITGKSLDEISHMSDAELDAMANQLEKKYGKE